MKDFWLVGITGRSGSGKSLVRAFYQSLGYPGVDADAVSREVCAPGSQCLAELAEMFGEDIIGADGALDRKMLAGRAFSRENGGEILIGITHPHIIGAILERADAARQAGHRFFFADGAVIVGAPFERHCDRLVLVTADPKVSITRVMLRDGISKTAVQQRLAAQQGEEALRAAADYVIENNGSEAALREKAREVLDVLRIAFQRQDVPL